MRPSTSLVIPSLPDNSQLIAAPTLRPPRLRAGARPWRRDRRRPGAAHDPAIVLVPACGPCTLADVDDRGEYSSHAGNREPGRWEPALSAGRGMDPRDAGRTAAGSRT